MPECEPVCQVECPQAFRRLIVRHVVRGGSTIQWELLDNFTDPEPHQFTLFAGHTANPLADDWTQVGLPANNVWYLTDDMQRLHGSQPWTHYRVRLVTPKATYWATPTSIYGNLSFHDWRLAKEIIRKQRLKFRYSGSDGFLLKRKVYGDPCTECLNFQTGRPQDGQCPVCYGTGILGGYYDPIPCSYVEFEEDQGFRARVDEQRGSVGEMVATVRMLADPMLFEDDVWVDKDTDQRWLIRDIKSESDMRAVPMVYYPVKIRLAEFSDVIYRFPIAR